MCFLDRRSDFVRRPVSPIAGLKRFSLPGHPTRKPTRQKACKPDRGIETIPCTTVALVEEEEEASPPGSANQKAAMAGELAKPLRPAPTPQSLALASEPAAESSRGCGYVD